MTNLLNQLLNDPTLPETVAALTARLANERQQRELFYAEMSDDQKIEFIHGERFVHSPARSKHLVATGHVFGLIDAYVTLNKLGFVASEKALCVFPRNDYEPDVVYFGPEKTALINRDTLKFPIPDWICEVLSDTTESNDRGLKYKDYAAHAVSEYWVIDTDTETIEQYVLQSNDYFLQAKVSNGEITSVAIPGLSFPVRAVFDANVYLESLRRTIAGS